MTHISVSKLTIIGSNNGLSPDRRRVIIWTNAGILLIGPLGTNFSVILIKILTFSFKKMRLKVSSGKCRPFCLGLNVLMAMVRTWLIWNISIVSPEGYNSRSRGNHSIIVNSGGFSGGGGSDGGSSNYSCSCNRSNSQCAVLLITGRRKFGHDWPALLQALTSKRMASDKEEKVTSRISFLVKSADVTRLPIYGIEFKPESLCTISVPMYGTEFKPESACPVSVPRIHRSHCTRQHICNGVVHIAPLL